MSSDKMKTPIKSLKAAMRYMLKETQEKKMESKAKKKMAKKKMK